MEDISNNKLYHPKQPALSPLWRILNNHYEIYEQMYDKKFKNKYGFFRPVINEVVYEYLRCGDLKEGFARVRCKDCDHESLLAFSCKGRWFCPSCHSKKVINFGSLLKESILYPVPHRQYVFTIPIMLRIYFKHDRGLLTKLCHCAYESLLIFLRHLTGLQNGIPGLVMTIHTFGNYPDKLHPHLHALVTDGLFNKNGTFYVMPKADLKTLEEIFRARVFTMLKEEKKLTDTIITKLMKWKHSGFSIDNSIRISRYDEKGREAVAQYILRNPFSLQKITFNDKTGTVIYRSKITHGKNKKNFNVYSAEEFIAAIT